jgi:hypothetical protein
LTPKLTAALAAEAERDLYDAISTPAAEHGQRWRSSEILDQSEEPEASRDEPDGGTIRVNLRPALQTSPTR